MHNPDGSYSTVYSTSFTLPAGLPNAGKAILIPTVVHQDGEWKIVSPHEAFDYYLATKKHLGVFKTTKAADQYAERLHTYLANQRKT